jgi:hypothetical protein
VFRTTLDDFVLHCPQRTRSQLAAKLSMTIRWLAGGSYLDICVSHRVPVSSFFTCCDEIIRAINSLLQIKFDLTDTAEHNRQSRLFGRGVSPLSGCCGAIDGLAVRISEPRSAEIPNPSSYYNRKGFFAVVVQAMCDASYRFTFVSAISPGSTHDSAAFAMSSLFEKLREGALPPGYWIAGDEAYVCRDGIITPYSGRRLTVAKDCFNYWQSSARIVIEQAFGILVARWGILWRPLRTSVGKATTIILALAKLHNYIIDNDGMITIPRPSGCDSATHREPADMAVLLQDQLDTDDALHRRRRDLEYSTLRQMLSETIELHAMRRPTVS